MVNGWQDATKCVRFPPSIGIEHVVGAVATQDFSMSVIIGVREKKRLRLLVGLFYFCLLQSDKNRTSCLKFRELGGDDFLSQYE